MDRARSLPAGSSHPSRAVGPTADMCMETPMCCNTPQGGPRRCRHPIHPMIPFVCVSFIPFSFLRHHLSTALHHFLPSQYPIFPLAAFLFSLDGFVFVHSVRVPFGGPDTQFVLSGASFGLRCAPVILPGAPFVSHGIPLYSPFGPAISRSGSEVCCA